VSEDEYWMLTPTEFERKQWAYIRNQREGHKKGLTLAWQLANLIRTRKRLPSLNLLLNPVARRLSPEEKKVKQDEFDMLVREMQG
jgi:hypothetical protein